MDVSKYHTRYPPKEHEEAVRMLLEGLDESRPAVKLVSRDAQLDETQTLPRTRDRKEDSYLEDRASKQPRRTNKQASPSRHQPLVNAKMLSKQMKSQADVSSSSVDSGSLARCSGDNEEDGHEEFDFDELRANSRAAPNDDLEFNSEESGSQDFIQVSPQIQPKRLSNSAAAASGRRLKDYEHEARFPVPKMQSKATSTASDSISTSGASTDRTENKTADDDDDLNGNYEAIPSRTIAIQCDLKLSSVKRDGYLDSASSDLASMQASSISSTRYGFYRLSPEVLEQRRQLARSVSSRNIAENNMTNPQRVSTLTRRNTIEAPTSISELSSVADVGELEPDLAHLRMRRASLTREQAGELRSVGSSDRDSVAARSKHDQRFFSQRQRQLQVNSRARQDSLPRRPKTALSYVSTSRLRHQQDEVDNETEPAPNRGPLSDDDDESEHGQARFGAESERRMLSRGRAMSQQVLSSSSKHRQPSSREEAAAELVNSNSDSELGAEKYRLPQQEELVVTRRGKTMGSSPQVSRSNAIRNGPLFRRATQQLDGASNKSSNMVQQVATTKPSTRYNKLDNTDELDYGRKQESIIREKGSLDAQTRARPSGGSHSTAEANQLATGTTERRAKLTKPTGHNNNNNNIMQGSRYGSMSLSRRPQQSLIEQGSCNLIQGDEPTRNCVNSDDRVADAGSGEPAPTGTSSHHRQSTRPMLLRRDRAGSQQVLPVSATLTRPERVSANRASSNQAAHVGRSSSMKQGRTRLVAAGGNYEEASRNDYEREEMQQHQRVAYTSRQPPADDDDLNHRTSRRQHYEVDDDCCKYQDCCGPVTLDGQMECNGSRLGADHEFENEREQQQKQQSWRTGASKPTSRPPPVETSTKRSESEDSESPLTRTWANPAHMTRRHTSKATDHQARRQTIHNPDDENDSMDYAPRYANDREISAGKVLDRKSSRSHSMRDVSHLEASHGSMLLNGTRPRRFETIYRAGQQDEANEFVEGADFEEHQQQQQGRHQEEVPSEGYSICSSSSANDEARMETLTRAQANHQPLDFDSQQRLNEIGLPEPSHSISASSKRRPTVTGSASHLGLSSVSSGLINRYATTGRTGTTSAGEHHHHHQYSRQPGTAITGRAMSQQSLTRPTMPLSRRLRRSGGTIGAGSGSDVGGSSISLVSRLRDGSRYENAHTRNPVVMLIPQAAPGHNEPLRASTRRASSRLGRPLTKSSGSRVSSQDRKNRSVSRNGSDSESSSSMLRTLIKPRAAGGARAPGSSSISRGSRRRGLASNNLDSDEENQDEIGQLASEIDSYKFRRRYSVPKDAKINWFSKLKQRVTSSKS